MPRSRSMSIRSRYCARIDRSSTTPVSCSIRSASVDLPWSMWAMMQKFRICAGAVKVWSAKLLMGISWSGFVEGRLGPSRVSTDHLATQSRGPTVTMLRPWRRSGRRCSGSRRTWCSTRHPSSSASYSRPETLHPAGHQAGPRRDRRHRSPKPPADDHRGPSGDQQQRPHRATGPQDRLRTGPRRPGRPRRDRLDLGGLRGRPVARQGPAGARGGPRPRRPCSA